MEESEHLLLSASIQRFEQKLAENPPPQLEEPILREYDHFGRTAAKTYISIPTNEEPEHWFCSRTPKNAHYFYSLHVMTYPENTPLREAYGLRLTRVLGGCLDCIRGYHKLRNDLIVMWRTLRISEALISKTLSVFRQFDLQRVKKAMARNPSTSLLGFGDEIVYEVTTYMLHDEEIQSMVPESEWDTIHQRCLSLNPDQILLPIDVLLALANNRTAVNRLETAYASLSATKQKVWEDSHSLAVLSVLKKQGLSVEPDICAFVLGQCLALAESSTCKDASMTERICLFMEKSTYWGKGTLFCLRMLASLPEFLLRPQALLLKMSKIFANPFQESAKIDTIPTYESLDIFSVASKLMRIMILTALKNRFDDSATQGSLTVVCNALLAHNKELPDVLASQLIMGGLIMRVCLSTRDTLVSENMLAVRQGLNHLIYSNPTFVRRFASSKVASDTMKYDFISSALQFQIHAVTQPYMKDGRVSEPEARRLEQLLRDVSILCNIEPLAPAAISGFLFLWMLFGYEKNNNSLDSEGNLSALSEKLNIVEPVQKIFQVFGQGKYTRRASLREPALAAIFLFMSAQSSSISQYASQAFMGSAQVDSFDDAIRFYLKHHSVTLLVSLKEAASQVIIYGSLDTSSRLLKMVCISWRTAIEELFQSELAGNTQEIGSLFGSLVRRFWCLVQTFQTRSLKLKNTLPEWKQYAQVLYPSVDCLMSWTSKLLKLFPESGIDVSANIAEFVETMLSLLSLRDSELRHLVLETSCFVLSQCAQLKIEMKPPCVDSLKNLGSGKKMTLLTTLEVNRLLRASACFSEPTIAQFRTQRDLLLIANSSPASSSRSSQQFGSGNGWKTTNGSTSVAQSSISNYFVPLEKNEKPVIAPPRITSHGITPSTAPQQSMISQVRQDLLAARAKWPTVELSHRTPPLANAPEIHPPRPPGFNHKERPKSLLTPKVSTEPDEAEALSSSDSESDTNADGGALIALGKKHSKLGDLSRRGPIRRPVNDAGSVEELHKAKRRRLRHSLDCTSLHQEILNWQYFDKSPFPSGFPTKAMAIPQTFTSVEEYTTVMKPLLLLEAWEGLQKSRDENEFKPIIIQLGVRQIVNDFVDIHVSATRNDFASQKFTETDIILLIFNGERQPQQPCELSKKYTSCIAKITEGLNGQGAGKTRGMRDFKIRVNRNCPLLDQLMPMRSITAMKIMSLTTMEREYSALMAIDHYDLQQQILSATPANLVALNKALVNQYKFAWGLNDSQAQAVHQAMTARGFSLIQGPPGTGKTKTILAILSAAMSSHSSGNNIRILVCAPSNAAVDEILVRLKSGIKNLKGSLMSPKLLRLGRSEVMNDEVKHYVLEEVIERQLDKLSTVADQNLIRTVDTLRRRLHEMDCQILATPAEVEELEKKKGLLLTQLKTNQRLLCSQREMLEAQKKRRDIEYHTKVNEALSTSNIICSTLSGSAFGPLSALDLRFNFIIVDEAAQAVELSSLIPLRHSCDRIIMVGDPHQLPPTVLSKEAARLRYEQSLFVRMFNKYEDRVSMLNVQFRMHPDIARFPSQVFYEGKLENGPNMAVLTRRSWHDDPLFPPFRFYDCAGQHVRSSNSFSNRHECHVVCELIWRLTRKYRDIDLAGKIGVISPYKAQVRLLRETLRNKIGPQIFEKVDIGSVDGFQGREKDIIIFTAVRASSDNGSLGFITDVRRMNVSLTRAKSSLWVVGHAPSLSQNSQWRRLIEASKSEKGWFSDSQDTKLLLMKHATQ